MYASRGLPFQGIRRYLQESESEYKYCVGTASWKEPHQVPSSSRMENGKFDDLCDVTGPLILIQELIASHGAN